MPRKCFGSDVTPAIRSDGAFSADGAFLPLPSLDPLAVLQVFRRMLLLRLHKAERLTESFMHNLLSWVHPGFSVYAGSPVDAAEIASLQSQARYITRPAVAMDALQKLDDGNLVMDTPPDPRTGATSITLDPLEWIHRLTSHIPDPGRHCQRFYGAYANRARISVPSTDGQSAASPAGRFGFLQGSPQHVGSLNQKNLRGGSPPVQLRGAHAHRLLYYRSPRGRPYPAPSGKRALPGSGSFRTEGSAPCPSNDSAMKPPTRQMPGCGPDACSVEVWMNAGRIPTGKRGIQDWQGFDGSSDRMKAH